MHQTSMTTLASDLTAVDLLEGMLRIRSLCEEEDQLAEMLVNVMQRADFDAHRDEVGNVVGTIGPNTTRTVVLLGHMDTVPGEVPVARRDGSLYGRGSVDAKGPLATAIVAAARAAERARLRLVVIGAVQEEGPSVGARHLTAMSPPDFLVIAEPSGWDAVVMGYKGSQRLTVTVSQGGGHTAGPEPTSAERAVRYWNDLFRWCREQDEVRGASPQGFESIWPTLISANTRHNGLIDATSLHIGLRLPLGTTPDEVLASLRTLPPVETGVEWSIVASGEGERAVRGEKGNPLVSGFLRAIREEGGKPRFKVKTGTSDMNVVGPVWHCPMLAYGPGDSRLDHTPHEHVSIDDYLRAIRVLTRVLEGL